jgi:hypothetical protein
LVARMKERNLVRKRGPKLLLVPFREIEGNIRT